MKWQGRIRMLAASLALVAGGYLTAVRAEGVYQPPDGCAAWLTVLAKDCSIANLYRCGGARGAIVRADFYVGRLLERTTHDSDGSLLEAYYPENGTTFRADFSGEDRASISHLLSLGADDWTQTLKTENGVQVQERGTRALTGATVTIDGVRLQEVQFDVFRIDDTRYETPIVSGIEYVQQDWGLILQGPRQYSIGPEDWSVDRTPVRFFESGEPGTMEAQFNCFRPG